MKRQSGAALIIVLITIGVLLVANVALVRSISTGGRIASNKAFKQGATASGEAALVDAENYLNTQTSTAADSSVTNKYFAIVQATDAYEMPTTVTWSSVTPALVGIYQVRWVVERLCTSTPVTTPSTQCQIPNNSYQGSQRAHTLSYTGLPTIYYRITAQVTGPRNAESYLQTVVAK